VTDKQIQEEREEKKRYLLRKLSFRPSVDELKNRKVKNRLRLSVSDQLLLGDHSVLCQGSTCYSD
jgi:hypothetical protein